MMLSCGADFVCLLFFPKHGTVSAAVLRIPYLANRPAGRMRYVRHYLRKLSCDSVVKIRVSYNGKNSVKRVKSMLIFLPIM